MHNEFNNELILLILMILMRAWAIKKFFKSRVSQRLAWGELAAAARFSLPGGRQASKLWNPNVG